MRSLLKPLTASAATLLFASEAAAGLFSLFDPIKANRAESFTLKTEAFIADDPVSLHDLFNDWQGEYQPKDGTNIAIDDIRIDLGGSFKKFGYFGLTLRHHTFITASKDLTLLVWQQLNKKGFTVGKRYDLFIGVDGFEADGIVYANSFTLIDNGSSKLEAGFGAELLRGRETQEGFLDGYALAVTDKDYDYSAVSDYRYSENYLYNLDVTKPTGTGFTTHISLKYRIDKAAFKLIINDLYGKIDWKRAPYSYVNINSSNKSYDENGFIIYNPTVSGVEKYIDYSQRLYTRSRAQASYSFTKESTVLIGSDYAKKEYFPYLKIDYTPAEYLKAGLFYESRFESFGVDFLYKGFSIFLAANDFNDPSALTLKLSYKHRF